MSAATFATQIFLVLSCAAAAPAGTQPVPTAEAAARSCEVEAAPLWASHARAIEFATRLAERGPRPAAGDAEARARDAVVADLESAGLDVTIEPFEYSSFRIDTVELRLGGVSVKPVIVGLDPYRGQLAFGGEALVITDPDQASAALAGHIIVTDHPLMQLMIAEHDPAVVICVAPEDLAVFIERGDLDVSLEVTGAPLTLRSANVVGRIGSLRAGRPEILITSHLDAYRDSPGANDNGTGLGAMIELARSLAARGETLPASVTFAAFGAEENGAIGSRAHLERHLQDLSDVVAVVNLDTLGGARGPVIGTAPSAATEPPGGVQNRIPEALRARAWEGPDGRWRMLHPRIIPTALTSRYPDWLQEIVTSATDELGMEVTQIDLISDHRTFALAGIPAISIQSREHRIHSAGDTPDALVPETVEACMRLAAEIVDRLLVRSTPRVGRQASLEHRASSSGETRPSATAAQGGVEGHGLARRPVDAAGHQPHQLVEVVH